MSTIDKLPFDNHTLSTQFETDPSNSFADTGKTHGGGFVTDAHYRILSVHGAFEQITGYTAAEIIGKNPAFLKSDRQEAAFYQSMWTTILQEKYWEGEIYNRRKDGTIYPEWGQISAVANEAGAIVYYVVHFSDISDDKKQKADLQYLALYDHLTGLPNRRLLESRIELAMARAERNNKLFAVCMIDLDNFKPINDTYGHDAGDEILVTIGKRLTASLRKTDIAARLGGDEFVLLIEDLSSLDDLASIFSKLEHNINTPVSLGDGTVIRIEASMGICIYPFGHDDTGNQLLRYADQALYESKAHKTDRKSFCTFFSGQKQSLRTRAQRLLAENALEVWYQPILNNQTGKISGVEALARLRDDNGTILYPAEFLSELAEADTTELSRKVLQQALADLARLDEQGYSLWVSFNVAAETFSGECVPCLQNIIAASNISPSRITLEILETSDFLERNTALSILHDIKSLGIRLALDDVGSAYASLLRLKELPIDEIKLDQGFIRTLEDRPQDVHFVRIIQDLAMELQLDLIVEGVETANILDAMITTKVPYLQGYAISRPLPLFKLQQFLAEFVFAAVARPISLFGLYTAQIASYTATKRMLAINSTPLDYHALGDGRRCRGHATLERLGYTEGSQLVRLHDAYHQALGQVAKDGGIPSVWKDMEAAQTIFVQAILNTSLQEKVLPEQNLLPTPLP
ncbi:MAG TPA: EAL domain-containing protein [Burkholderiales bacterium]|nr:EAL domain-containing protein [Burkholderiales bacterium]